MGTDKQPPLRIALGNPSCDMDSVIGSIAMGYFFSITSGNLILPVINTARDAFPAKFEIIKHLKNCKIPLSDLYYMDELR